MVLREVSDWKPYSKCRERAVQTGSGREQAPGGRWLILKHGVYMYDTFYAVENCIRRVLKGKKNPKWTHKI